MNPIVVWPHVAATLCCAARLLPIAFLCPLLGGQLVPGPIKVGLVLFLAGALHFGAGVTLASLPVEGWELIVPAGRELILGLGLGLLVALPYDAARTAGRWMDSFRGASAEAALPGVGTSEAAAGDLLHQLLLGIATVSGVLPLLLRALWHSYRWVPLGRWALSEQRALTIAQRVGETMGTALSLGLPLAAAALLSDSAIAFVGRMNPQARFQELAAPLRLTVGAALFYLGLGIVMDRLMADTGKVPAMLTHWLGVAL